MLQSEIYITTYVQTKIFDRADQKCTPYCLYVAQMSLKCQPFILNPYRSEIWKPEKAPRNPPRGGGLII